MWFYHDKRLEEVARPWWVFHVELCKTFWEPYPGVCLEGCLCYGTTGVLQAVNMTCICRYFEGFYNDLIIPANREKIGKVFWGIIPNISQSTKDYLALRLVLSKMKRDGISSREDHLIPSGLPCPCRPQNRYC